MFSGQNYYLSYCFSLLISQWWSPLNSLSPTYFSCTHQHSSSQTCRRSEYSLVRCSVQADQEWRRDRDLGKSIALWKRKQSVRPHNYSTVILTHPVRQSMSEEQLRLLCHRTALVYQVISPSQRFSKQEFLSGPLAWACVCSKSFGINAIHTQWDRRH